MEKYFYQKYLTSRVTNKNKFQNIVSYGLRRIVWRELECGGRVNGPTQIVASVFHSGVEGSVPGFNIQHEANQTEWQQSSASKSSIRRFVITEKAPTRAFSWLKAATTAFTFKTLLRHYAKLALTTRSLNVKLGPRRKGHKGRAGWLAQCLIAARPL